MCDCKPGEELDADSPLWWKLVSGLILGGLIASLITDPRAR